MKLPRRISDPGFLVSALFHAGVLAALLVTFSHASQMEELPETVPVDLITDTDFSQIMHGDKSAKEVRPDAAVKVDQVDKTADPKPAPPSPDASHDAPSAPPPPPPPPLPPVKVDLPPDPAEPPPPPVPTPPVRPPQPAAAVPAPAPPVPTPPVREAEAVPEVPKPDVPKPPVKPAPPKPAPPRPDTAKLHDHRQPPQPKPHPVDKPKLDQLAKLIEDQPAAAPAPKPSVSHAKPAPDTSDQDKFDPTDISRLLSRDAPAQRPSTGRELSKVASLGSPTANAPKMAPSMWAGLDGLLEEQYRQCWSYLGLSGGPKYIPQVRVVYSLEGGLQGDPVLLNQPGDPEQQNLADSALRAVRRCNPLHIPDQYAPYYDQWKGRVLRFDPAEMAG